MATKKSALHNSLRAWQEVARRLANLINQSQVEHRSSEGLSKEFEELAQVGRAVRQAHGSH
jgi:hypothetical protein